LLIAFGQSRRRFITARKFGFRLSRIDRYQMIVYIVEPVHSLQRFGGNLPIEADAAQFSFSISGPPHSQLRSLIAANIHQVSDHNYSRLHRYFAFLNGLCAKYKIFLLLSEVSHQSNHPIYATQRINHYL